MKIEELKNEMAARTADRFRKEMGALGFSDDEMIDFFRERCRKEIAAEAEAPERVG